MGGDLRAAGGGRRAAGGGRRAADGGRRMAGGLIWTVVITSDGNGCRSSAPS